jgi:hypothetical protein
MISKKITAVFALVIGLQSAFSQIATADQPGNAYYDYLKGSCVGGMPSEKELLAAKSSPVGITFIDTLKKYDWVNLGGYSYHDKIYEDYFAPRLFADEKNSQFQFNLFRILKDGTRADFSLNKFKEQEPKLSTTSFTKANCQVYEGIKIAGGSSFLQTSFYGEVTYTKIVSFRNGILVVDISRSGALADKKIYFRNVYRAVDQKFSWTF